MGSFGLLIAFKIAQSENAFENETGFLKSCNFVAVVGTFMHIVKMTFKTNFPANTLTLPA